MTTCDHCGIKLDHLPFVCKRCHKTFCIDCHLPENHDCSMLVRGNMFMNLIKKNTFPNYSNIYRDVNYKPFEKSKVFKKGINQIEQNSVDDNIFNRIMNNNKRLSKMIIDDCSKFDLNRPVLSFKDEKCSFMKKKEWMILGLAVIIALIMLILIVIFAAVLRTPKRSM